MSIILLIATSFSLGFFIESIIGFGGALIAYSILGFFMDLKGMVIAGLYIGTLASLYIFYTDYKSFDKTIFLKTAPLAILGTIIGVFIFSKLSPQVLSLGFAIILITLSSKIFFFDNINLPNFLKKKLILIGGIAQGAFGTGGPFFANALKENFQNKSALRTTMAAFFVSFNIIRFIQLSLQQELKIDFLLSIWWTIIPVFVAIKLGHFVHLKISESFFKKLIAIITFLSGIKFLTKFWG